MTLLFDVGNTEIKLAIAKDKKILNKYRFKTKLNLSDYELYLSFYNIVKDLKIKHMVIASVVPEVTYILREIAKKHLFVEPLVLESGTKTSLKIIADNPKETGADLVACSVGASALYEKSLVIDLGTAIKYLYVKNNTLCGVIIAPGMEISLAALTKNTALLPKIDLKIPKKILGNDTVSCMQSGVLYGTASQIDCMVERIKKEVKEDFEVIITGGFAELLLPILEVKVDYRPNLIFEGLLEILERNKQLI
ncbi:MAG TPA: type III pantothenate kinase [Acholeplasma sp.]|jgi:type III pantothenate kinase|nr:type III pantothenate kinase [Acholeplasma sp.]